MRWTDEAVTEFSIQFENSSTFNAVHGAQNLQDYWTLRAYVEVLAFTRARTKYSGNVWMFTQDMVTVAVADVLAAVSAGQNLRMESTGERPLEGNP